ncbi:WAT1-related protein [Melia azedarach]|uniref:WAT1-related protein n=1 Tax=Melia azedarach TaxID=155640 RepID=A0ACC1YI22_MELAZ|nr:WAT1-related protein [Melia azedarach]
MTIAPPAQKTRILRVNKIVEVAMSFALLCPPLLRKLFLSRGGQSKANDIANSTILFTLTILVFWAGGAIVILALLGPVIDQNFYYAGLKFTSPTFSCAMSNMLPAMTFVMAVICRMEKLNLKKVRCQAKAVGTLVTVAGAMLMTLYKGPIVELFWSKHVHPHQSHNAPTSEPSDKDWFIGSIFLIIATLAWAALFVLQVIKIKLVITSQLG